MVKFLYIHVRKHIELEQDKKETNHLIKNYGIINY